MLREWRSGLEPGPEGQFREVDTEAWNDFCVDWLTGHLVDGGRKPLESTKQPKKLFRKKARDQLRVLDHQLRVVTGLGLSSFQGRPGSYEVGAHGLAVLSHDGGAPGGRGQRLYDQQCWIIMNRKPG